MRLAPRWGALLSAALAGCSPASTVAPAAPEPSPLASASPPGLEDHAAEAPPDRLASLPGDDVLTPPAPGADHGKSRLLEATIQHGRGLLHLRRYLHSEGEPCPIRGNPPGCTLFELSPAEGPAAEAAWNGGLASVEPRDERSSRLPAPRDWQAVAGAHGSFYALSTRDHRIDRIDAQGKITPFLDDPRLGGWGAFWVFERGERVWMVAQAEGRLFAFEAAPQPAGGEGPPRALSQPFPLDMARMFNGNNAKTARRSSNGHMVMAGEPRFFAMPDPDHWGMAWLEVAPPARGTPRGPAGDKNGCGRSHGPSRPLSDPSVDKRAHLSFFRGTSLVSDSVAWSKPTLDPGRGQIAVSIATGSLQVTFEKETTRHSLALEPDEMQPELEANLRLESVDDLAFDQASGEGALAVWRGEQLFFRRFDREGRFSGETLVYPHRVSPHPTPGFLRRVGGRWFAMRGAEVRPLSSGAPPQTPLPEDHVAHELFSFDGNPAILSTKDDVFYAVVLDERGRRARPPVRLAPAPERPFYSGVIGLIARPGQPTAAGIQLTHFEGSRSRVTFGTLELKPGGAWTPVSGAPFSNRDETPIRTLEVPGDLAAFVGHNPVEVRWLASGKSASLQAPAGAGSLALPSGPGQAALAPGLLSATSSCRAVSPRDGLVLFLCAEGVDPRRPGLKTRLIRWVAP